MLNFSRILPAVKNWVLVVCDNKAGIWELRILFPFCSYLSSHKSVSAVTSWVLVSLLCEIKYVNCQDRTLNICMNILTVRLGHSEEHSTGIFEVIRIIFIDLSRDRLQPDPSLPQVYKNINVGRGRVSVSLDSTGPHLSPPPGTAEPQHYTRHIYLSPIYYLTSGSAREQHQERLHLCVWQEDRGRHLIQSVGRHHGMTISNHGNQPLTNKQQNISPRIINFVKHILWTAIGTTVVL